jgi:hypothetical protein
MIAIRHGSLDADAVITRTIEAQEQSRRKGMRVRGRRLGYRRPHGFTRSRRAIVIAVLALVVAWVQLTRIREERQRNFFLTQLVDRPGRCAPGVRRCSPRPGAGARVCVLPPDMLLIARAWVTEDDHPPSPLCASFERERKV